MKKPGGKRFGGSSSSGDKKSGGKFGKDFSGKKPFVKKDGERSFRKSDDDSKPRRRFSDDKPAYGKSSGDKPFGERKPFGDRKASGDKPFKKSFGDKPYGEKKSFGGDRRSSGDKPFKKSFGDKPYGEKKSFGGDRERSGDRPFKKSFGDKPFGEKKSFGDRKPSGDRPFKKSFGDKPFGEKKSFGGDRERSGDKPFKKPFGDKPYGDKKPFGEKKTYGEKKSFGDEGERKPYRPFTKSYGDKKPSAGKSFGDKRDEKPATGKSYGEDYTGFRKHDEMRKMKAELGDEFVNEKSSEKYSRKRTESSSGSKSTTFSDDGPIRLNRYIANTGICSRREADDLIAAGVIKVNGKIVTELGTKIGPGDEIHYGDQLLRREKMSYVLLNKPKDYITTTDDPQERKTVLHLVEDAGNERIYPVGRLDRHTTGLLLLTNDGDLASRLMHPKYGVRKIYHVSLDKNLRSEDFDSMVSGVELEDGFIKADELSYVGDGLDKKEVGIVMHSGRNRIVRRLFEHFGYAVIGLDRVVYAGLTKKNLPRSRWRHLSAEEVGMLKMLVGGAKKGQERQVVKRRSKRDSE